MDGSELLEILKLFFILIILVTITTKLGFTIQRSYIDIKVTLASAAISILVGIILIPTNLILGFIVGYAILLFLICKWGEVELLTDAIFATIIASGLQLYFIFNYSSVIFG